MTDKIKTIPNVTVVIPAYNAEKYIIRSIESVLNQTRCPDEIIVVDDGSKDNTANIVRSFGDRVTLIQQPNAGVSAARNTGIKAATGDWIAFLDADDEWLPEKVEWQAKLIGNNPELVWATGNYIECLCDEDRRAEHIPPQKCIHYLNGKGYYESYLRAIQLYEWGHTDCVLIQKHVFDEVGTFNTELVIAEDLDMWLRIAYRYPKVGFSPQPLAIYHLAVSNSLMRTKCPKSLYAAFIGRHLQIAETERTQQQFLPAAGAIMRRWIRSMLFEGRKAEIRELLHRFPQAFSFFYRMTIYSLTIFPKLTVKMCHGLSCFIRLIGVRRKAVRKPSERIGN